MNNTFIDTPLPSHGLFLIYKPTMISSFLALKQLKKLLHTKKVGHTGTLDPFASGLLLALSGPYTRLATHFVRLHKSYIATVQYGATTKTLDNTAPITYTAPIPSAQQLHAILPQFQGTITQIPPRYSAIHINGVRAYKRAHNNETFTIPSRTVEIFQLTIMNYDEKTGVARLMIHCSSGTYIRSLAHDIACACNSCAHLIALERTAIGSYTIDDAYNFEHNTGTTSFCITGTQLAAALPHTTPIQITNETAIRIKQGQSLSTQYMPITHEGHYACLYNNQLYALIEAKNNNNILSIQYHNVFITT